MGQPSKCFQSACWWAFFSLHWVVLMRFEDQLSADAVWRRSHHMDGPSSQETVLPALQDTAALQTSQAALHGAVRLQLVCRLARAQWH